MRCITSGRLTPAAMTFSSTSPAPGSVTGRCSGTSISGPPGERMAITVMLVGMVLMAALNWAALNGYLRRGPVLADHPRSYNRPHHHASLPQQQCDQGLGTHDCR